jgi:hypothetical protein
MEGFRAMELFMQYDGVATRWHSLVDNSPRRKQVGYAHALCLNHVLLHPYHFCFLVYLQEITPV